MAGNGLGLNTLEYAQKLEQAGVPREQAEAHALVFYEITTSNLASKRDIEEVKKEIKELETRVGLKMVIIGGSFAATTIGTVLGAIVAMAKLGFLSIQ